MNNNSMRREYRLKLVKRLSVIVSILFVIAIVAFVVPNKNLISTASGATLYVGGTGFGNFSYIQDAITASMDGDTIFVYNGTYNENVVINKIINLTGEDRDTTIIDGLGSGDVVRVEVDWVNITGFTVTGGGSDPGDSGIDLDNVRNCRITNNNVSSNNYFGILLYLSDRNSIIGNNVSNNNEGIRLLASNKNNITGNTFFLNDPYGAMIYTSGGCKINDNNFLNNEGGISLEGSADITITGNNISSNNGTGIHLYLSANNNINRNNVSNNDWAGMEFYSSPGNTIADNNIFSNDDFGVHIFVSLGINITNNTMIHDGIFIEGELLEHWNTHSIDTSNTVNSKPVQYWKNQTGGKVPAGAGEVILANCTNVSVEGQELTDGTVGVELGFSFNNHITGNNASSNDQHGIYLYSSDRNTIIGNNASPDNKYGIYLDSSNGNTITGNNTSSNNRYGIYLDSSNGNTITGNNASSNNEYGIFIKLSSENNVVDNNVSSNDFEGIYVRDSSEHFITNNNISSNNRNGIYLMNSNWNFITSNNITLNTKDGVSFFRSDLNFITSNNVSWNKRYGTYLRESDFNTITDNNISSNNNYGMDFEGASSNTIDNCIINNNPTGVHFDDQSVDNNFINSSISNSGIYDFHFDDALGGDSHATTLNTTFDKTKVYFKDILSNLTVKWFMHVKVIYWNGSPVNNADIWVNDTYDYNLFYGQTPINGWIRWIVVTEYVENQTNGKYYYTPHKASAAEGTRVGNEIENMDMSKEVIIVLGRIEFSIPLKEGWNMISIPLNMTDTTLKQVLSDIDGNYIAVQWYNVSDSSDTWKHYHINKVGMNDLANIERRMGIWILMKSDDTLTVTGSVPVPSTTNITLKKGWNFVGYPSLTSYNRTDGLNNLTFDTHVDAILSYNASTQKWEELGPTDYFKIGRGYWIHAKVEKVWEVPL